VTPVPAADQRVDLGRGLLLQNRVGLASGTAGYGFEIGRLLDLDRIGALYTKGTTAQPRAGNRPPRVAETDGGMLNSIGLQNPGIEHVLREYAPQFGGRRCAVVLNLAGGSVEEYVHCAARTGTTPGIAALELNISCPNIAHGLDFGRDPSEAARLVAAVRAETPLHLMVKLTPNVTDIAAIARAVAAAGADSISAVNTFVGTKFHRATGRPVLPGGTGGLSGPAIRPLALAAVAQIAAAVAIPVVGVGGIVDTDSARDFLSAGAVAVQVGTINFVDPTAAIRIVDGLAAESPQWAGRELSQGGDGDADGRAGGRAPQGGALARPGPG
jgi:dihydroorotate dehydrogenase (NAD+) catalytic subunit